MPTSVHTQPSDDPPLPIDAHRSEILSGVYNHRVIIIHGEVGCGKSSRLPVILLDDAQYRDETCRMMVKTTAMYFDTSHFISSLHCTVSDGRYSNLTTSCF